jgi:hypothetical protein
MDLATKVPPALLDLPVAEGPTRLVLATELVRVAAEGTTKASSRFFVPETSLV